MVENKSSFLANGEQLCKYTRNVVIVTFDISFGPPNPAGVMSTRVAPAADMSMTVAPAGEVLVYKPRRMRSVCGQHSSAA